MCALSVEARLQVFKDHLLTNGDHVQDSVNGGSRHGARRSGRQVALGEGRPMRHSERPRLPSYAPLVFARSSLAQRLSLGANFRLAYSTQASVQF